MVWLGVRHVPAVSWGGGVQWSGGGVRRSGWRRRGMLQRSGWLRRSAVWLGCGVRQLSGGWLRSMSGWSSAVWLAWRVACSGGPVGGGGWHVPAVRLAAAFSGPVAEFSGRLVAVGDMLSGPVGGGVQWSGWRCDMLQWSGGRRRSVWWRSQRSGSWWRVACSSGLAGGGVRRLGGRRRGGLGRVLWRVEWADISLDGGYVGYACELEWCRAGLSVRRGYGWANRVEDWRWVEMWASYLCFKFPVSAGFPSYWVGRRWGVGVGRGQGCGVGKQCRYEREFFDLLL